MSIDNTEISGNQDIVSEKKPRKPRKKETKPRKKCYPPPIPPKPSLQFGNKFGVGHGRPKTWNPEVEAAALLEWLEKPSSIIIVEFSTLRGYDSQRCSDWYASCPVFREAYTIAKQTIAGRREKLALAGKIKEGVFHRYQGLYDKQLHAFERAEKEFDAKLKQGNTDSGANLVQLIKLHQEGKISMDDLVKLLPHGSISQSNNVTNE